MFLSPNVRINVVIMSVMCVYVQSVDEFIPCCNLFLEDAQNCTSRPTNLLPIAIFKITIKERTEIDDSQCQPID